MLIIGAGFELALYALVGTTIQPKTDVIILMLILMPECLNHSVIYSAGNLF